MLEIIHQNCLKVKRERRLQEQYKLMKKIQEQEEYEEEQRIGRRNNIMLFMHLTIFLIFGIIWVMIN